jgi:hypothetical protein
MGLHIFEFDIFVVIIIVHLLSLQGGDIFEFVLGGRGSALLLIASS